MGNSIQYTSRDFESILADIKSDEYLKDKPDWYARIWAGVGDMLSVAINAVANNMFLRTAFTRQAVIDICRMLDFELQPQTTANGNIIFYMVPTVVLPKTFSKSELKAIGNTSGGLKVFEARNDVYVDWVTTIFTVSGDELSVSIDLYTGEKVRCETTGVLPGGLSINTDYYIIRVSSTKVKLATSLENAYNGVYIPLTGAGSGTHQLRKYSFMASVYQQESFSDVYIGTGTGKKWEVYDLPDINILQETITIRVDGEEWSKVTNFVSSSGNDKVYKIMEKTDGKLSIMFGDGIYGKIIPVGSNILVSYAKGGGLLSNVYIVNNISTYAGTSGDINGVSNNSPITGGNDAMDIEEAKVLAPMLLKSQERFILASDGEYLALKYGGVSQVKVNPNTYGLFTCQVVIVPNGGGTSSSSYKSELQSYLTQKTILGSIDVYVEDPDYISVDVTMSIKVKDGYVFANISDYVKLAIRLMIHECGKEVYTLYKNNTIAEAKDLINNLWSYSFGQNDYNQIKKLLDNIDYAVIGKDRAANDIIAYVDSFVDGVDYVTMSAPTGVITVNTNQITTTGTISVSEI